MANKPKRATVKDVAQVAGVSWKTVTNVMHGRNNVRESTRAKVMAAAAQVGYRASLAGRQLRSGRSNIVALAVPELGVSYFAQLAHRFIEAGDRRGVTVFTYETFLSAARELSVARERIAAQGFEVAFADGVILSPLLLNTDELRELPRNVPLVVLGEAVEAEGEFADHIAIDNVASARELTHHLLDQGRERIHFLGSNAGQAEGTDGLRQTGWRQALRERGIDPPAEWVWPTEAYSMDAGAAAVKGLLGEGHRPDALICGNDELALGALHALRLDGFNVPADVAVAGWDDAPAGRFSHPTLTTVKPDLDLLVEAALDSVLARIDGDQAEAREIVVPHSIEVRESTTRLAQSQQ